MGKPGRLDVFTRVITDYGDAFEEIRPAYKGKLYAEIVPLTSMMAVVDKATPTAWANRLGGPGTGRAATGSRGATTRVASWPSGI